MASYANQTIVVTSDVGGISCSRTSGANRYL